MCSTQQLGPLKKRDLKMGVGENNSSVTFSIQAGSLKSIKVCLITCIPVLHSARPGSTDPRVTPSLIVTFDLGTVGFYNQLVLFNTLNNALNRGRLATYRVSPVGFTFRSLSGKSACPPTLPVENHSSYFPPRTMLPLYATRFTFLSYVLTNL